MRGLRLLATICLSFWTIHQVSAVTLDREGKLSYWCEPTSVQGEGDALDGEYIIQGKCTYLQKVSDSFGGDMGHVETNYYFLASAKYFRNPVYESGEAKEAIIVYTDPERTNEIGDILGRYSCPSNPFIGTPNCTMTHMYNTTDVNVLNKKLPLTGGLVSKWYEGQTGSASQGLTVGQEDLSDWNPYAGVAEGKAVKIVVPNEHGSLLAGKNYEMVMKPGGATPTHIIGEFQRAEMVNVVGDIAMPEGKQYPTNWKTIYAPLYPSSSVSWGNLNPTSGNARSLTLYTGNNSPFPAGTYRVRLKAKVNGDWIAWEPWRHFKVIGSVLAKAAQTAPQVVQLSSAIQNRVPGNAKQTGITRQPTTLKPGANVLSDRTNGLNELGAKTRNQTNTDIVAIRRAPAITINTLAKLSVKSVGFDPAPLTEGKSVKLSIEFENNGNGQSHSNHTYTLKCRVLSGGPCPMPEGTHKIGKSIAPGAVTSINLLGAQPASPGQYRLLVVTGNGSPQHHQFEVQAKPLINTEIVKKLKVEPALKNNAKVAGKINREIPTGPKTDSKKMLPRNAHTRIGVQ